MPMMVAQIKGFYKFSSSYGSYSKPQKRKNTINQNANSSEVQNNVFHTDIEAVKQEIKNVKNGNSGFLSYAQIAEIIINMDDIRKNLPPDKIQAVYAYYTKLQNNKQIYEMSKIDYARCCLEIINGFESIVAPSYKSYCKIVRSEMNSIINLAEHNNISNETVSPAVTNISTEEKKDPLEAEKFSNDSVMADNVTEAQFHLLEKLSALHKRGILTDEEFSAKKREILDRL